MSCHIRPMRSEDVLNICRADSDESDGFKEYLQKHIERQGKGECAALVADYDGNIAGHVYVYFQCRWGGMKNQGLPAVVDLKVFRQYRGHGVGSALMDEAERIAGQYSDVVYLDVGLNKEYGIAQQMYVRRGYVPDGNGVYYRQEVCSVDADCKNNDELTLCLIKQL